MITPFQIYFNPDLIFRQFQFWRLLTNFVFFGTFGFNFLFNMIFLYPLRWIYCVEFDACSLIPESLSRINLCQFSFIASPWPESEQIQVLSDVGRGFFSRKNCRFCLYVPARWNNNDCILLKAFHFGIESTDTSSCVFVALYCNSQFEENEVHEFWHFKFESFTNL